jgi:hypothetical protein
MRTRRLVAGIVMVLFGTLAMLGHALAQDDPYPVELKVGEAFEVCASGLVGCPAIGPICDDPKVAIPVDIPGSGLGFRGVGPGSTLCSAISRLGGFRRVFRITVR